MLALKAATPKATVRNRRPSRNSRPPGETTAVRGDGVQAGGGQIADTRDGTLGASDRSIEALGATVREKCALN
jgi:hypothetical protein